MCQGIYDERKFKNKKYITTFVTFSNVRRPILFRLQETPTIQFKLTCSINGSTDLTLLHQQVIKKKNQRKILLPHCAGALFFLILFCLFKSHEILPEEGHSFR